MLQNFRVDMLSRSFGNPLLFFGGSQRPCDFFDVCFLQVKRMEADELYWTKQHVLYGI